MMDRLTNRNGNHVTYGKKRPRGIICGGDFCRAARNCKNIKDRSCPHLVILDLLADYEDTGLTPEEVKELSQACIDIMPYMNHIKDLLNAEAEGRLIVLPCKVGDTVHRIARVIGKKGGGQYSGEYVVTEYCVTQSYITDRGVVMFAHKQLPNGNITTSYEVFGGGDIGKTVFLTREEAEAALGRADT